MPAYNFQSRFADAVQSGRKTQTIRADRADGRIPKIGSNVALYTGMRTQNCRLLARGIITTVRPFEITGHGIWFLAEEILMPGEAHAIAVADGFTSARAMREWFEETHGLPFKGVLIEWKSTDIRNEHIPLSRTGYAPRPSRFVQTDIAQGTKRKQRGCKPCCAKIEAAK
jgi:hypothetical protein